MEFRIDYAKEKKVIGTAFLSNYSGAYQKSSYFGMLPRKGYLKGKLSHNQCDLNSHHVYIHIYI